MGKRRVPHFLLWLLIAHSACTQNTPAPSTLTGPEPEREVRPRPRQEAPRLPPIAPPPGDKLWARLTDLAGLADLIPTGPQPGLSSILASLETPYKLVSPYSGLRGDTALRVLEVAIGIPNVETYPEPAKETTAPPRFDPVWNRYRGVYESKLSLLLPTASCYRFRLALPTLGTLVFHSALLPKKTDNGKAPVELSLSIDDRPVWSEKQTTASRWDRHEVSITAPVGESANTQHDVKLCGRSDGSPVGIPVIGNPELWAKGAGAAAPNLLLIIVDTLRADAVSAMPEVQKFAQKGARFEQAITSATWTRPALLSLLGGDLPSAVGQNAEDMIPKERDRQRFYALDRKLLPRVLRESGVKVTAIGNNFFLLGYPQIGLSLGFDEVADVRHPVADSPAITRAALRYLQENRERSFFLQLHYDAPHWPYSPPPQFLPKASTEQAAYMAGRGNSPQPVASEPSARSYLAEAAYADAQIAQVLAELDRLALSSRTMVVIVGDHGEVFDINHNHFVLALKQPTLYHHGWSAYDEILRVPMILAMPGRLPQGVVVKNQVRLFDVAPTVLEALGLWEKRASLPSGNLQQGQSLLPLMQGEAESTERAAFVEGQNVRALRSLGYLYLRRSDPRLKPLEAASALFQVPEELYDLRDDPQQHRNLLQGPKSPLVEQTLRTMREQFSRHAPRLPDAKMPVTHLALAPGPTSRQLHGLVMSSDLQLAVAGVRDGEVTPLRPGQLEVLLQPGGQLDVHMDPDAKLDLQLTLDGLPLAKEQLLLGPYSLPLLSQGTTPQPVAAGHEGTPDAKPPDSSEPLTLTLQGTILGRLFAAYPPVLGERGDVLLWRDQPSPGAIATSLSRGGGSTQSEVATVMRDWGYAQPEKTQQNTQPGPAPAPTPNQPGAIPSRPVPKETPPSQAAPK
ncbi:MAG TPA: sulfatase [Pseudomonadota bacterium]|jgi:arylsulfatase A-like enzyme|nr:sulfatase [Pseudomonadota bacterium]